MKDKMLDISKPNRSEVKEYFQRQLESVSNKFVECKKVKNEYITYENLTKEILDTVKVGDLVKCNDWKSPIRVVGVSDNYFIMATNKFGKVLYSICQKKIADHNRNYYHEGKFRIGTDNYVFGIFDYLNNTDIAEALQELENGKMELSVRKAIDLILISVKIS